jgi:translation initiation factor 1A
MLAHTNAEHIEYINLPFCNYYLVTPLQFRRRSRYLFKASTHPEHHMSRKEREEAERQEAMQEEIRRVKLPRDREVIGILTQRLGAGRCYVRCLDGKTRVCRVPGRLKRKLWVREHDIVLVEPWELGGDEKGDIVFKYRPTQVQWLQHQGYLDKLQDSEEF